MPTAKEKATQFVSQFIALFPETDREELQKKLAAAPEAALNLLGEGVLRQDEFSRAMDAAKAEDQKAKTWHADLDAYHARLRQALDKIGVKLDPKADVFTALADVERRLKAAPAGGGNGDPDNPPAAGGLTKDDVKSIVQEIVSALPKGADPAVVQEAHALATFLPALALRHFQTYGKPLDTVALVNHSKQTGLPIDRGGYEDFIKDELAAKTKADHDKEIKEAEDRGAARTRAELAGAPPYPVGGGSAEGTLAGLTFKDSKPDDAKTAKSDAVTKAAEMYNRAVAARAGGGSA